MSNLAGLSIVKKIEIDKNHIENYVLETEEGTKRTKEKFHREASEQRNVYVRNELSYYQACAVELKNEMTRRLTSLMPKDKTDDYIMSQVQVDQLLDLVILHDDISACFKLKLDFIVSSITENTSWESLNSILDQFLNRMRECGVSLTLKDFQYSMFTEQYMNSFLKQKDFDSLKATFEKIYFACPDIKMQLKMNLQFILNHYEKELVKAVSELKNTKYQQFAVDDDSVILKYVNARQELGTKMATDEYYNTKVFLEGKKKLSDYLPEAPARNKNYDMFVMGGGNHASLSLSDKEHYDSAMMSFYLTLNELKKYYHYESMIQDLAERYKQKDSAKTSYMNKKKEIEKEEGVRQGIYKDYLKATGVGLFARKNEEKMQHAMLKMNEQIRKLHTLYDELKEMDITYQLANVPDSASIYDLFLTALRSFSFLEKFFTTQEFFQEKSLEDNVLDFFKFLYNPNNYFLRKIHVFADYNVTDVVAEKYRLLNLNVSSEMIQPDTIDATLDSAQFINLIQNVNRSTINFHTIDNIYQMNAIVSADTKA